MTELPELDYLAKPVCEQSENNLMDETYQQTYTYQNIAYSKFLINWSNVPDIKKLGKSI